MNDADGTAEERLGNVWEYSGPSGPDKARIFSPKEIPEKHAKLDALDKFRLPRDTPQEEIPKRISEETRQLSPLEKLRTHYPSDDGKKPVEERNKGESKSQPRPKPVSWK